MTISLALEAGFLDSYYVPSLETEFAGVDLDKESARAMLYVHDNIKNPKVSDFKSKIYQYFRIAKKNISEAVPNSILEKIKNLSLTKKSTYKHKK